MGCPKLTYRNETETPFCGVWKRGEGSKELKDLYDFEARMYDPVLGRTFQLDPHLENYYEWSPYSWTGDDPILMIDPDGMDWYVNSESGNLHWYNGTYEEDNKPEGYSKLGGDDFFGEESSKRLESAKENHKNETGESLESMSFDEKQSEILAGQFGFSLVPTYRFVEEKTYRTNIVAPGAGLVTVSDQTIGTRVNEKFTYAPKDYISVIDDVHHINWNPALGSTNTKTYVEEISYKQRGVLDVLMWAKKKYDNPSAGSQYSERKWNEIKSSDKLYKYRPSGIIRRSLGF
jgi:RHS repeat-associated protein